MKPRTIILMVCSILCITLFLHAARPLLAADFPIIPIPTIQGDGMATPLAETRVDTVGIVTGITATGFYLQDPIGDGDPQTSDGIFVYTGDRPLQRPGDCVRVLGGYVSEFYDKTELSRIKGVKRNDLCPIQTVTPITLTLPSLYSDPAALLEPMEGMLVEITDLSGVVHGPTKRYDGGDAEFVMLPGEATAVVSAGRIFHDEPGELSGLVYVSGALGASLPDLNWGDRVAVGHVADEQRRAQGLLDYNFGKYQLILLPTEEVQVEQRQTIPDVSTEPTGDDEFTICTANLWGMGSGSVQYPDPTEYEMQLRRRAQVIAETLAGCTIVGLQEIGAPLDVANLAAVLRTEHGLDYAAWAFDGPQSNNREFPLTNAFLTRSDRVRVLDSGLRQACSPVNYEVIELPDACEFGRYSLYDRPPLMLDVEVSGDWGEPYRLHLFSNHWKSKAGDEQVNQVRRVAQARHGAELVQEILDETPDAHVVILGDLNDYFVSEPLQVLRSEIWPPLAHAYDFLPALDRYTYIFNGGSQVLDHMLISDAMLPALAEVRPLHINADFAAPETILVDDALHHASDHDPVVLRLRPQGVASLGGNVGVGNVTIELVDASGVVQAGAVSDEQGDFRVWGVAPGQWHVRLIAPAPVTLTPSEFDLALAAGPATLPPVQMDHATIDALSAAALLAPMFVEAKP